MKPQLKPLLKFSAAAVLLSSLPAVAGDFPTTVLSQSPTAYFRLQETTTPQPPITTAANIGSLAGGGNGTYEGTQGFFRGFPGALASADTAVQLDGATQDILVPYNAVLNPTTFTVEGWFKAAINSANCAVSCGHFGSPRSGWLIYQDATTGYNLRMYNQNGTTTSLNISAGPGTSVVGAWCHVVATFDGSIARLYINGIERTNKAPTGYIPGTDGPFAIGMRSDVSFRWAGNADEVAYYNTVLSANDVAAHYSAATTNAAGYAAQIQASSPLLYFRLNEAGDPPAQNLGSAGGPGAYVTGSKPGQAGPQAPQYPGLAAPNYAVGFDGTGGSVAIPALNMNTDQATITAWVKASGQQVPAAGIVMCTGSKTVAGLTMDAIGGGLNLGYRWANDAATYNWRPGPDAGLPEVPDNDWAFVALVVQPTHAAIYVAATNSSSTFVSVTNFVSHAVQDWAATTSVGSYNGTNFNGSIDEVSIFNRALTAGEVYSQYGAALGNVPVKIFADPQVPVDPVYAGDTLTLTVDAGGTPDLTYQWRRDGQTLSGATTSVYVKAGITTGESGVYDCVVGNAAGPSKTSSGANITINPSFPPSIVEGPVGRTIYPGGTLTLSVVATGGGLRYQWYKAGTQIAGATQSSYVIPSVVVTNTGVYSVIVSNSLNSATGGPATVNVVNPDAGSYAALITADKPEAWWRLNEASGTTMYDSMGRHDGVYTNLSGSPVAFGVPGALFGTSDSAVMFDGTSESWGQVPYSAALNTDEFTIEAWAKTTSTTYGLSPISTRYNHKGCLLQVDAGNASGYGAGVSQLNTDYRVPSTAAAGASQAGWTHIVLTYAAGTAMRLYINGQWDGVSYVNFDRNATGPMIVGARGTFVGATLVDGLFNGSVDEVAVYTKSLTLAQAQAHYQGRYGNNTAPIFKQQPSSQTLAAGQSITFAAYAEGSLPIGYQWTKDGSPIAGATTTTYTINNLGYNNGGAYRLVATNAAGTTPSSAANLVVLPPATVANVSTNGLVLHLKFDDNLNDSSSENQTAAAQGSPAYVAGKVGTKGIEVQTQDAVKNYVEITPTPSLVFGTSDSFSIAFWLKFSGSANDLPIIGNAVNSTYQKGWVFSEDGGKIEWTLTGQDSGQVVADPVGGPTINNNTWHHIVATFDRGSATANTYVDGFRIDTRSIAGLGTLDTGNNIVMGQDPTGTYAVNGTYNVDDLGIWRRVLSATEVCGLYNAGNSGNDLSSSGPITLGLGTSSGGGLTLVWQTGTLVQSASVSGPWTPVSGAVAPSYTVTPQPGNLFFKVQP